MKIFAIALIALIASTAFATAGTVRGNTLLFPTKSDFDAAIDASESGNKSLVLDYSNCHLKKDTPVSKIESASFYVNVRVLEGPNKGCSGWTFIENYDTGNEIPADIESIYNLYYEKDAVREFIDGMTPEIALAMFLILVCILVLFLAIKGRMSDPRRQDNLQKEKKEPTESDEEMQNSEKIVVYAVAVLGIAALALTIAILLFQFISSVPTWVFWTIGVLALIGWWKDALDKSREQELRLRLEDDDQAIYDTPEMAAKRKNINDIKIRKLLEQAHGKN